MWGLLQGLVITLDLGCALAVFVILCKPDFFVGLLAWGWLPSRWDHAAPLDEDEVELLRVAVARLRVPAVLALAALAFASGALLSWLRLQ